MQRHLVGNDRNCNNFACDKQPQGQSRGTAARGRDDKPTVFFVFSVKIGGDQSSDDIAGEGLTLVGMTAEDKRTTVCHRFRSPFGIVIQENMKMIGTKRLGALSFWFDAFACDNGDAGLGICRAFIV